MKNSPWKLFISGDANQYQIVDSTGNWIMAIQHNGEHLVEDQLQTLSYITKLPELLDTLTSIANQGLIGELVNDYEPDQTDIPGAYEEIIKLARKVLKKEAELPFIAVGDIITFEARKARFKVTRIHNEIIHTIVSRKLQGEFNEADYSWFSSHTLKQALKDKFATIKKGTP